MSVLPPVKELWLICWIFMCLNGMLWLSSGILNARELWTGRKDHQISGERHSLIADELGDIGQSNQAPRPSVTLSHSHDVEDKSFEAGRLPTHLTTSQQQYNDGPMLDPYNTMHIGRGL